MEDKETDPKLPVVKARPAPNFEKMTEPERLQYILENPNDEYQRVHVRLIIDEINHYDEGLPVEVVRGLLSPSVPDFFILIEGIRQIPREKAHYLHTSYIREVLLLDELPAQESA
jgi:hypothetical protein